MNSKPLISVLILTYNAPEYVEETLVTLNEKTNLEDLKKLEIIVVDNASQRNTVEVLNKYKLKGYIDKLYLSSENLLFAKGNNHAATLTDDQSEMYLLLNSDISIKDPNWLRELIGFKENGGYIAASYGFCTKPKRCDGYCLLIDRNVYDKYLLSDKYEWWYSVTKIQSEILKNDGNIIAIGEHDSFIFHYGGKSGNVDVIRKAKGMNIPSAEIKGWYNSAQFKVTVKHLNWMIYLKSRLGNTKIMKRMNKLLNSIRK